MFLERLLHFSAATIVLLALSLLAVLLSVAEWPRIRYSPDILLLCGMAAELILVAVAPPAGSLTIGPFGIRIYAIAVQLFCLGLAVLFVFPSLRRWWFPTLVVAHCCIGIWVVVVSRPVEDVLIFQQQSAEALMNGGNPYTLTFPDPYGADSKYFYGNGLSVNGRLLFGYPYLPASLLFVLPGYFLGDVRFSHLAAVVLAALVMFRMARDDTGKWAAGMFLFTPWVFHMEEIGWTEPFLVLMFAITVALRAGGSRLVPLVLALFLALKQYTVLVLPLALQLLGPRPVGTAAFLAGAVTLPFAFWDLSAFLHSAVWLQFRQPWRSDVLSFAVLLNYFGLPRMPWLGFVAAAVALIIVMRRRNAEPAVFARDVAFVLLAFFAFNKQAFYNYYFLVLGALCTAIAASGSGQRIAGPEVDRCNLDRDH